MKLQASQTVTTLYVLMPRERIIYTCKANDAAETKAFSTNTWMQNLVPSLKTVIDVMGEIPQHGSKKPMLCKRHDIHVSFRAGGAFMGF